MWSIFFAEATAIDAVSGGAGWVGTGLLGSVLMWIFFRHLPDKDRQIKEFIEGKDKQLEALTKQHAETMERQVTRTEKMLADQVVMISSFDKDRREDFKSALHTVVEHCSREASLQRDMMAREIGEASKAIIDLREVLEGLRMTWFETTKQMKQDLQNKS